jgi:hydroxyacylglutathione hydrolase
MQQPVQEDIQGTDYFIHQFSTSCLAQFSYYIESGKEAIIIDPIRDIDIYLEMLNQRGANLKYIFETHYHADFVSGHLDLSNKTGAQIVYGPTAKSDYEIIVAEDNQDFSIGSIKLRLLHTPGHTLESSCFLLIDSEDKPKAVFTGDCVFLGDVGRPDLAVKGDISENDLASMLYESVQRIKKLPDDVIIFPGHGAGSACGKQIGAGTSCIVGRQKINNYAFNDNLSKQEFIEIVTSNIPTPPQYFFFDVMLNKKGYESLEKVVERSLVPIAPERIFEILEKEPNNYVIIDSRDFMVSINNFLKGSYLIALKIQYAIWTANLFSPDQKILLITEPGKEKESVVRLARVGYENVVGYVAGGFEGLLEYATKNNISMDHFVSFHVPDLSQIKEHLEENVPKKDTYHVLDVREPQEWQSGVVHKDAMFIPLKKLEQEENIQQVLKSAEGKTVGVHCKTGGRAAIAGSILKKHGVKDISFLGGTTNMQAKNFQFANK